MGGSLVWDLWFGIFGLGTFVLDLWFGSLVWELLFGIFGLGPLVLDLWFGNFCFRCLVWELELGIFGLGSLVMGPGTPVGVDRWVILLIGALGCTTCRSDN